MAGTSNNLNFTNSNRICHLVGMTWKYSKISRLRSSLDNTIASKQLLSHELS